MLVLSRKNDESVVVGADDSIGGRVKVTVLEIGHGSVSLGFEANKDVPVHSEEVWERMHPSRPRDPPIGGLD
jgi:carbon storage regulator